MKTPITYYGGKQKMARHILPLIPQHRLYTEAFAGGAAVFFAKQPSEVEVIKDRPTNTHEYILLFSKNLHYYYDYNAIMEKSACDSALLRNKRSVWTINTKPLHEAHFAAYPPKLVEPMILAGCRKDGIVLDPFMGAESTALTARKLGRNYVGIELNPQYVEIAQRRLQKELGIFL